MLGRSPDAARGAATWCDWGSLDEYLALARRWARDRRDNLGGWFASEGLLGGDVHDPPSADQAQAGAATFARLASDCAP